MGNYEKARDYAEKVMLSEDPLIDLTGISLTQMQIVGLWGVSIML